MVITGHDAGFDKGALYPSEGEVAQISTPPPREPGSQRWWPRFTFSGRRRAGISTLVILGIGTLIAFTPALVASPEAVATPTVRRAEVVSTLAPYPTLTPYIAPTSDLKTVHCFQTTRDPGSIACAYPGEALAYGPDAMDHSGQKGITHLPEATPMPEAEFRKKYPQPVGVVIVRTFHPDYRATPGALPFTWTKPVAPGP